MSGYCVFSLSTVEENRTPCKAAEQEKPKQNLSIYQRAIAIGNNFVELFLFTSRLKDLFLLVLYFSVNIFIEFFSLALLDELSFLQIMLPYLIILSKRAFRFKVLGYSNYICIPFALQNGEVAENGRKEDIYEASESRSILNWGLFDCRRRKRAEKNRRGKELRRFRPTPNILLL